MSNWTKRVGKFNKLNWANASDFLKAVLEFVEPSREDMILDVGCATGILTQNVALFCRSIIGIDFNLEMIRTAYQSSNIIYIHGDIMNTDFKDNSFDKIVARNSFHHVRNLDLAFKECQRILKDGGTLTIIEGVPPSERTVQVFTDIFELKEDRHVFMEDSLKAHFKKAGFKELTEQYHMVKDNDIRNWLDNDGTLSDETINKICDIHTGMAPELQQDFNIRIKGDQCLCDFKFLMMKGVK